MTRTLSLLLLMLPAMALAAPPAAVTAVAYHPGGTSVAFASQRDVLFFDPESGNPTGTSSIPAGQVTAMVVDASGKWLAVAGGEPGKSGEAWLVPLTPSGVATRTAPILFAGHKDSIYALAFSPDGRTLATAGYDRVIHLWDVPANPPAASLVLKTPRLTLKDHSDTVYGLSFHPGGELLASAGADRAVKVWAVATGKRLYTLSDPTDWVYCVAWSPDRKHLAAGGVDRSIRVWAADHEGGKLIHSVYAHERPVWRLAYATDGNTLWSSGEDRVIKAWDAARMTERKVFAAQADSILDLAVRPDGKQLAIGCFDGIALLIDPTTGKPTAQPLPRRGTPPAPPVPGVFPKPDKLVPIGGGRGNVTKVIVTGTNLDHLKQVTTSSPEVKVTIVPGSKTAGRVELQVKVSEKATIGAIPLTFEGDGGKAAPITFAVDRFPAVAESGLTDSARAAQTVKLPATIVGTIDRAGDVDYYRFEAGAGEQVGVQVIASELGSKLDAVLVLTDGAGTVLAEGNTSLGFVIPRAGSYAVGIHDKEYRGATDMTYRLHVGNVPVITGIFPLAVQRGRTADVHVEGVNLGSPGGLQSRVTVPADVMPGSRIPVPVPGMGEKPLGAAFIVAAEFSSVVMDPITGADLRVPGSADGILTKPREAQVARFAAKKGEKLVVEVLARRVGSPVDPVIEILDGAGKLVPRAVLRSTAKTYVTFRDHDSVGSGIRLETWNELAIDDHLYVDGELVRILDLPKGPDDDCQFYQAGGQRLGFLGTTPAHHSLGSPMYKVEIHPPGTTFPPNGLPVFTTYYRNDDGGPGFGKDSFVIFEAPAEGNYQVRVTDARGASGPTHAYRVTVRPPKPDFTVSFNPTAPTVWKGSAVPVSVTISRLDGFNGAVQVQLEGLPTGLHAPGTFVEAGQTTTAFALFADNETVIPPTTQLKLVARATIEGKEVIHESIGGIPKIAPVGDLLTRTRTQELNVKPGQETRFVVDVERQGKFSGRVPVEIRGLPHGVRVLNIGLNGILINEKETSREVVLYAEPWVQPMEHPIVVLSRSEGKGTEHAARSVLLKVTVSR